MEIVHGKLNARISENNNVLIAAPSTKEMAFKSLRPLEQIITLPEEHELRSAKAFITRQSTIDQKLSILKLLIPLM